MVIALGNRFRGDDAVGSLVADILRHRYPLCTVIDGVGDALDIIGAWENADLAVIVDATTTGKPPGTVLRIETGAGPLPKDLARCSSHGLGIAESVALSETMGLLPARLVIYAIEARTFEPGAAISPEVIEAAEDVALQIGSEFASGNEN